MQTEEHAVGQRADREHVFAQTAGTFILARGAHRVEIRRGRFDGDLAAEAVGRVEGVLELSVIILQPEEHVDEDRLVAAFAQRFAHGGARHQRDVAFGGDTAAQNNDFQGGSLPFH